MTDNDEHTHQDRRLQTLVHDLDKKVHALELSDRTHGLDVNYLKGEVAGIRSSTATSFEVKAAIDLVNERLDSLRREATTGMDALRKEVGGIKSILIWFGGAVGLGLIAAGLRLLLRDGAGL
jgi:hypothetical protein